MEEQLAQLLANTQRPEQQPRQQAELDLRRAETNPAFPTALANIASHATVDTSVRQSALTVLRRFIEKNWAPDPFDNPQPVAITDDSRQQLRASLLSLALSKDEERRVKISTRYVFLWVCGCVQVLTGQLCRWQDCHSRFPPAMALPPPDRHRRRAHGHGSPAAWCAASAPRYHR